MKTGIKQMSGLGLKTLLFLAVSALLLTSGLLGTVVWWHLYAGTILPLVKAALSGNGSTVLLAVIFFSGAAIFFGAGLATATWILGNYASIGRQPKG